MAEAKKRAPRHRVMTAGAGSNRHMVAATPMADTEWRRDVHDFNLIINTPASGEVGVIGVMNNPGQGFTRQLRRVAIHGGLGIQQSGSSASVGNAAGVFELALGLAVDIAAFTSVLRSSEASGLWRRYVSFAQGAATFKFWLPSGWDMVGDGVSTAAGEPMNLYAGATLRALNAGTYGTFRLAGLISTQEKELRVYS